jgi:predicted PhzF superfamily epimerase YddE/YHI9
MNLEESNLCKTYETTTAFSFASYTNRKMLGNGALTIFGDISKEDAIRIAKKAKTIRFDGVETDLCVTSKITYKSDYEYDIWHYYCNGSECLICGHATLVATRAIIEKNKKLFNFDAKTDGEYMKFQFNTNKDYVENIQNPFVNVLTNGKCFKIEFNETNIEDITQNKDNCHINDLSFQKFTKEIYGDNYFKLFKTGINDYVVICKEIDIELFRNLRPSKSQLYSFYENVQNYRTIVFLCKSKTDPYYFEARVFIHDCPAPLYEDTSCGSVNTSISAILFHCNLFEERLFDREKGTIEYKILWPFNVNETGFYGGIQNIEYFYNKKKIVLTSDVEMGEQRIVKIEKDGNVIFNNA